jgi:prevent-host-death family protein
MDWQLADAKNRFSELVSKALTEGPQRVRRRKDTVVVIAEEEYDRLHGNTPNFIEFLLSGPEMSDLDLTRDKRPMRNVDFGPDEP